MTRKSPFQLQLLPESEETTRPRSLREQLAAIMWSYSRRSVLEQCARRYYYEYYGANLRTARSVVNKDELHFLKQLSTRHERAGSIVHLVIAWYLREVQKGKPPNIERLTNWGRQIFAADRVFSRDNPDGVTAKAGSRFPPVLLREYYYRDPVADTLCDEMAEQLEGALTAFVTDERLAPFRHAATVSETYIEASVQLGTQVPCRVGGKVDFAFRDGQSVTVVDWKMGNGRGSADDSLQLAAYGLWAIRHSACDIDDLRLCKAHLNSHDLVDFRTDAAVLVAARARIIQDAERMLDLHEYGETGIAKRVIRK